ncbi:MAG: lysophospholipid acyltransferase family protein [Anaerolineae bacterium]|nr:lysophospholipid acyltransferase family protein [Anaerolineae bacterium]
MSEEKLGPPRCGIFFVWVGKFILRISGWKIEGSYPPIAKSVAVFAPHTSNWDFIYMLSAVFTLGLYPNWIGKKELFFGPMNFIFKALGGIPVNRKGKTNMVSQIAEQIRVRDQVIIGIAPEGTRSKSDHWKSGFYYIAQNAEVPIVLITLDYSRKSAVVGPSINPSGDIEADLQRMAAFFGQVTAKYPHEVGQVAFRSQK